MNYFTVLDLLIWQWLLVGLSLAVIVSLYFYNTQKNLKIGEVPR